jgi:oxygen-dependent protoporphyrinogen oxidase
VRQVAVVGAGLGGLVAAHALRDRGLDVTVFEAAPRAGGKLRTDHEDGYLLEWGPQSVLWEDGGAFARAVVRAGLSGKVVDPTSAAKRRFVLRRGALRQVPREITKILDGAGLLRAGLEPLIAKRRRSTPESVADFARRRFGREAAERLFDALVSGVFAGDPERLEVQTAFARMWELERDHGSVVRAGVTGAFKPRTTRTLEGGLGTLPDALGAALGDSLRLSTPVESLRRDGASWTLRAGASEHAADAVVLATPAFAAADLLADVDAALTGLLREIPYAPLVAVSLGYPATAFARAPEGFGFLVPRREGWTTLGCLYPSAAFPGVAPAGKALLRVMAGGRRRPELLDLDDPALVELLRGEVEPLLGVSRAPELVRVARHRQAIPQYELGHGARVRRIEALAASHPGLHLTGNPYRGVSLGDVALDAERVAETVAGGRGP